MYGLNNSIRRLYSSKPKNKGSNTFNDFFCVLKVKSQKSKLKTQKITSEDCFKSGFSQKQCL